MDGALSLTVVSLKIFGIVKEECAVLANRAFKIIPIGVVESGGEISTVRIFPRFCNGLYRLDEFSHLIVLYWFHKRDDEEERHILRVVPKRHQAREGVSVFASRSPSRPNSIGVCVARLVKIKDCRLMAGRV